jgi:hypothetical protein
MIDWVINNNDYGIGNPERAMMIMISFKKNNWE